MEMSYEKSSLNKCSHPKSKAICILLMLIVINVLSHIELLLWALNTGFDQLHDYLQPQLVTLNNKIDQKLQK